METKIEELTKSVAELTAALNALMAVIKNPTQAWPQTIYHQWSGSPFYGQAGIGYGLFNGGNGNYTSANKDA